VEIQALNDQRAVKAREEDIVEVHSVDELRKSGFVEKLQGNR
jgi:hypothetical protein